MDPYRENTEDKMKVGYWLGVIICLMGCDNRDAAVLVDPSLDPYFNKFVVEANLRGIDIEDHSRLIGGAFDDLGEGVRGQCQHLSDDSERVVIDRTYWNQSSSIEREFIVFHELGHCILNRSHLDTKSPRGECASIMHSSSFSCRNTYDANTREQLLDELFSN